MIKYPIAGKVCIESSLIKILMINAPVMSKAKNPELTMVILTLYLPNKSPKPKTIWLSPIKTLKSENPYLINSSI